MKKTLRSTLGCMAAAGCLWGSVGLEAAALPYFDAFDVPPYVNNTTIVGQQGWQLLNGTASAAVITNDFTGSGRGTSLFIGNGTGGTPSGNYGNVKQTFGGITNDHWKVKLDFYGNLPSSTFAAPITEFYDDGGSTVASLAPLTAGVNKFRLNNNSSYDVPGIAVAGSTWYTAEFHFHMATLKYDFTITDGVSTGALNNVPFWLSTAGNIDFVRFIPGIPGSYANESGLIDNISVIPETSTALLAFGGLLAVALGARRR